MTARHWTSEELEALRRDWGAKPAREIAADLNRSTCSIIGKAFRLGLRRIAREQREEWIRQGYRRWMRSVA